MKNLFFLLVLVSGLWPGTNFVQAQDVLWNKMYVKPGPDFAYGIVEFDTNQYYVLGSTTYSVQQRQGWNFGMTITRINGNGDTLWSRYGGLIGTIGKSIKINSRTFVSSGFTTCLNPPCNVFPSRWCLVKIDTSGSIIDTAYYNWNGAGNKIGTNNIELTQKKEILVSGSISPSVLGNAPFDWWVAKYDTNLNLIWQNVYNPRSPIATACVASEDFNGRLFLSGQKLDGVAYIPIDSNGRQLDTAKTLLRNPYPGYGIQYPFAKRHPDGGFVVSFQGYNPLGMNNRTAVIGKIGANLQPEWVYSFDSAACGLIKPIINSDGSIIFCFSRQLNHSTFGYFVSKISSSGQFLYNKQLASAGLISTLNYYDIAYRPDESAIFVGSDFRNNSNTSDDYVITKISRVGSPFNPVHLDPVYRRGGAPYPNPCVARLTVPDGSLEGLRLFNSVGQSFTPQATQTPEGLVLDTEALPAGIYQLSVVVDAKTHLFKVLKQ